MDTRSLIEQAFENRAALAPAKAPLELLAAIDECLDLLGTAAPASRSRATAAGGSTSG